MLVTFQSSTSGEIMMFAPVARVLLGILGKECTARGVITLEQLPDEIALLRAAIQRDKNLPPPEPVGDPAGRLSDESAPAELPIGFVQRATPFVEMLDRTLERRGYVMWQAAADFGG